MYTGPWSQLGELKFDGCTFNSLIVGGLAAQGLNFTGCTFKSFTNTVSANNSNPVWIRPAYGNWSKGDNEGQGNDFKSLTSIVFENNTVASTRPVKFERIAQWEMETKVEVTGNSFDMASDGSNKNVGLYFGANAKFDLVLDNNNAEGETAALYTAVYNAPDSKSYAGLPAGSTVKNAAGEELTVTDDAVAWKTTDKITLASTKESVALTNAKGVTVNFATIEDALAAVADGDTITLLEDVTVEGKQVVIDKKITIDLNGKTLKVSKYTAKAAQIDVTGELTVKDSAEGGLICSDYTGTAGLVVCIENGGKFTLESGTITTEGMTNAGNAVKVATGGEFVMNGGTVKADAKRANRAVNVTGGKTGSATFTMNGGSIIADKDPDGKETSIYGIVGSYYSVIALNGGSVDAPQAISASSSTISVKDGDYKGTVAVKNGSISGGTFDTSIDYRYLADGYVLEEKSDGTYGLKEGKYVAAVGTVGYETLQAAINAAEEKAIVKLVADTNENVTIEAGKNITLDLNGFTLNGGTGTAKAAILNYGTVVIKDSSKAATGTIKREDSGIVGETSYYVIHNLGEMTIESGNIENNSGYKKTNPSGSMVGSSLICNGDDDPGATLYVKGGKLTQLHFLAIKNGALGNLFVTGGEITSEHSAIQNWFNASITGGTVKGQLWTDAWKEGESVGNTAIGGDANFTGEIVMDITGSVVPKLAITGGTLDVTDWRITNACATAGGKPEVSGGTFTSAVDESYCADGFIPTENENGTYGVKVGEYVVKIGEVKYDSLNAAEKAAKDGDTITLIKDVVLTEQVATGKAITIDGAGFEIRAAAKLASASGKAGMFYRTTSAKGTLTFKNVTLNGNGVSKIFLNEGGAGETVFDTVVSTNGGGMAYGSGIHISGGGSHATIKNSTLTGSTGTMELNATNYYAANDLWVGGNVEVIVENSVIGNIFVNTTGAPATSVHGHLIVRGDETEIGYIAGENDVADKNGSIGSLTTIEGGSVDTIFDGGLYEISGGTFKTELKDEWLKDGFNAVRNEDGTYGVKTVFHVSDRYNGDALAEFSSLDEAFAYAAENNYNFIVVNGTYTLTSDLAIPDGKYFEVTGTLTIGEGVKVTVNKTSKHMSVLAGGKVINNGTILLLGEDGEGYFMLNGGTLEGNPLTAPEGYAIAKNGNSYRIINIATAGVKVEYEDGSVQYFNGTVLTENAKKITLLRDFEGVINIVGTSSVTYNVEIDLGGHTITKNISMGSGVITVGYANVVIKNGTVVSTSTNGTNKPALKVYSHGNVTVADDVTLDGGTVQPAIYLEGGEVALYGTATSKGGYAITTHGLNEHNTVITIKDGATVTAENGAAIYNPHGDLIIEGGVITGKIGVQICAGSLSISGNAQISATGAAEAHEGDGAVFDGSAVSIIDRAGAYTGLVSIEITGGTFTSAHGKAIRAFAYDDTTETEFDNSSKVVKVSGGTFSSEVDASLIKDGCKLISVNGAYGVFEKQILGASVTLGEDISFNYYVKAKTENTVVVVKYMKNGTMTEETLTEFVAMTNSKYAGKYVFRGITPQMIARGITVVYTDGSAYDIVENYSVADYLERAYKNANNTAETKQLAADAMYYGLAAMKYRKADEADIADVQARITELGMTGSAVEMTDSSLREGENIVQVSVRFDNANSLVFAVKNSVFEANSGYKYYIGNTEITEWNTTLIAGYHVYTTEALRAVEYVGKAFTVTVKSEGKVVQTLSTDVGSYCARIAASESYAAELKELAKATYAYGVSAKAYANRSNNG